ncbi:polysaccharide deacetylase family protein [Geomonas paludis]|uniref:Polysaccharide deacetylase family protein n=2 Tax=Geomonas paludis TaxID=2740185 RepID=A0ABY4LKU8_9BACT|nr:polysaccharide deacetylase family protein [Geomonas paludis]UPU37766.1 polysaccharide deacetylase family protein [Geomonas paludis]
MTKNSAFILMYHRILDERNFPSYYLQPGMYVMSETFEKHVLFLNKFFNILPFEELIVRIQKGKSIRRCCCITFDDGWSDNYFHAYPILKTLGVPATIFLATGYVGTSDTFWTEKISCFLSQNGSLLNDFYNWCPSVLQERCPSWKSAPTIDHVIEFLKEQPPSTRERVIASIDFRPLEDNPRNQMLTWEQVTEMYASGLVTFGSHTVNHELLDQVGIAQIENEIILSGKAIESRVNAPVFTFAYPNGNFNAEIQDVLSRNNYVAAVTTKKGMVSNESDLMRLPRIGVHEDVSRSEALLQGRLFLKGF